MPSVARVGVAKGKRAFGVGGAGPVDWAAYEVIELVEALTRTYRTDAHLVTYVVPGASAQPRINKAGLGLVPVKPVVEVFFCDVDNDAHAPWTDDALAAAHAQEEQLAPLATAGVYYTAHGRRFVQPLAEPIQVGQVEPHLRSWLRELEAAGLAVDWHCADWTRHFRLPHVRRAGQDFRSPRVSLERMRAVPVPQLPSPSSQDVAVPPSATSPSSATESSRTIHWTREVPRPWIAKVERLAEAVRGVTEAWHPLFLDLAGALLTTGLPAEHVPVVCRSISVATGADTRTGDREAAARATVRRRLAGKQVTGLAGLRRRYPAVAEALEEVTARGARARVRTYRREASPLPPVAASVAALEHAIRTSPPGVTMISAECGLGKTQAAIRVAVERAAAGLRTCISVDKNALASQIAADIGRTGTKVLRVFGPLSVLSDDGTPECRFHESARLLAEAGQSVRQALCEGGGRRCQFWNECRAREGRQGPPDASVVVGPHALLPQLEQAAGADGLLVIDEPPSLIETTDLPLTDLELALDSMSMLDATYASTLEPAVLALGSWAARVADADETTALTDAARAGLALVDHACVAQIQRRAGFPSDGEGLEALLSRIETMPHAHTRLVPVQLPHLLSVRRSPRRARRVATVSRVCGTVQEVLRKGVKVSARISTGRRGSGARVLKVSRVRPELRSALGRSGPTVVLDANADLHVPAVTVSLGRQPPFHSFAGPDGAPIQRVHLCTAAVNRARWRRAGRLLLGRGLLEALAAVLRWASEEPAARTLGIITFLPLKLAMAAAIHPDAAIDDAAALRAGISTVALVEARDALRPVLAAWPGEINLGHYGGVRGMDSMRDVDCLATLGDPWPNLDEVRHDVTFFGFPQTWEQRAEALCRAELEQAHGRLRAIHRQRPGRAMHVGRVLPGGSGWETGRVEQQTLAPFRKRNVAAMDLDELRQHVERLGGVRAAARAIGCSHPTVLCYLRGRAVPAVAADALRSAGGSGERISRDQKVTLNS